jgi:orotate phosphoribosyltransferase
LSAVQEFEKEQGLKCVSIVTLADLIDTLSEARDGRERISAEQLTSLRAYRERYGVR